MPPPHILLAGGERSIRLTLETGLTTNGFRVTCVSTEREALLAAASLAFDAAVVNARMSELQEANPGMPIMWITDRTQPVAIADVVAVLRRLLASRASPGLIGCSAPMVLVDKLIAQAARIDATVLITGESGTGKELVARSIHDRSARASHPFISVNCSGLTDTLLESELFGHTRGAFTGAVAERGGLFEAANCGTLFLDELASTSAAFQASLLRVLQCGEVRRVGATQTRRVNVRVIGASNAPLRQLVETGSFRADLYYRLSVFGIDLPPLRARMDDLPLLTEHFLQRFSDGDNPPRLSREASEALSAHDYPGNVRELENALRRAMALCSDGLITVDCLPSEIAMAQPRAEAGVEPLIADRPPMEELQRRYLKLILEETGWNRRRTATMLNLDRRTIQRLIARYGLDVPCPPFQGRMCGEGCQSAADY